MKHTLKIKFLHLVICTKIKFVNYLFYTVHEKIRKAVNHTRQTYNPQVVGLQIY